MILACQSAPLTYSHSLTPFRLLNSRERNTQRQGNSMRIFVPDHRFLKLSFWTGVIFQREADESGGRGEQLLMGDGPESPLPQFQTKPPCGDSTPSAGESGLTYNIQ